MGFLVTSSTSQPSGPAGGDLGGTYPNPIVDAVQGQAFGVITPSAGNVLVGNGAQWNSVAMSGDATINAGGSLFLATVNPTVGSFGSSTQVAAFTVDAEGRITGAANVAISYPPSAVTSVFTQTGAVPNLSGDVTTSGSSATTLATVNANVGSFGTTTQVTSITVNAKGLITAASNTAIAFPVTSVSGTTNQVTVSPTTGATVVSLAGPHNFTTLTNHGILLGQGTSAIAATAVMSNGQLLVGQTGADPTPQTVSGYATLTAGGVATVTKVQGTATNDNATAGDVGEFISSNIPTGSAVSLSTGTAANVTSISLTAGDWDVYGNVGTIAGAATITTSFNIWIGTVSATAPTVPNGGAQTVLNITTTTGSNNLLPVGKIRISIASTTTVYLGVMDAFSGGTLSAYGFIGARRVR